MIQFKIHVSETIKLHIFNFVSGRPIEINCRDLTRRYANDVIATCAFGLKVDSYTEGDTEFFEMGKKASEFKMRQMIMILAYSAFPTFVKVGKLLRTPTDRFLEPHLVTSHVLLLSRPMSLQSTTKACFFLNKHYIISFSG